MGDKMDKQQISEIVKRIMNEDKQKHSFDKSEKQKIHLSDITSKTQNISLETAKILIERVINRGAQIGIQVVCAVVNGGARPVAVMCADDSYIASYDIAMGKAYTSASLKMKTSVLKDLASPGGSLYGIQHTNGGQIVIFGGGIPLKIGGKVIGGFGVSGGTEEQDTYLGDYAEAVFEELISER